MSEQAPQPVFSIEKIYVKDLSLEIPNSPQVFLEREGPQIDLQVHSDAKSIDEGVYESVVTVTVTAKVNEKTLFLVEAAQAGIFQIRNFSAQDMEPVLAVSCPTVLFPYARETISDMVVRAGFPPVLLAPINFEVMYQQRKAQAEANAQPN